MVDIERKLIPLSDLKAIEGAAGGFAGYGSVFGNVDSYGDIVVKGAFADTIPDFLRRGFTPVGHEWHGLPVAMPTVAREDDKGLFLEAEFHSTGAAQDARTVVAERAAKGLDVGLSIGYQTEAAEMITAEAARADGLAKDTDPEHWLGGYRLLKKLTLFEVSIVTVPANTSAMVVAVKSDTPFVEHAERLSVDLKAFAGRARDRVELLTKEGRVLSEANRDRIKGHLGSLREIAGDIEALLVATETPPKDRTVLDEYLTYQLGLVRARDLGLLLEA